MIVKYLLAALVAGLFAGVLATVAQQARVVPLILEAEKYEKAAAHDHAASISGIAPVSQAQAGDKTAVMPGMEEEKPDMFLGVPRIVGTLMGNLVAGAGFALLLAAVALLTGQSLTLTNGAIWGACGWLAMQLMPATGLPPELPGFPAADLLDRQMWWVGMVVASAIGVYLLALRREAWAKVVGVIVLLAPHLVAAPEPSDIATNVPAVLAAEFAAASLATGLFFWVVVGVALGFMNDKMAKAA